MSIKQMWKWLSFLLFVVGMVFAVIGGIWWADTAWIAMMLAIFGVIIGFIYAFSAREINMLLLASIALLVMTRTFAPITFWEVGPKIDDIMAYFASMVAPIAIISAVKALVQLGLDKD